jgi:hypothetical protein
VRLEAFASGDRNRIANGNSLLVAYNKLGDGGGFKPSFHWTPQFGDTDPEASVRRVTVRSDDEPLSNSGYTYTSRPRVISPADDLDPMAVWDGAVRGRMKDHGLSYTQATDQLLKDGMYADLWDSVKSYRFSPLLTKSKSGWRGQPDPPQSHTDPEESEDDLDDIDPEGRASHRRHPKVHKSLPAIAAALKKHFRSGGGGVPRS